MGSSKGSSSYVTGYRYYMDAHMVPCYGPVDAVTKIIYADRVAWSGRITQSTDNVIIDAPGLLGGDEREGGLAGTMDIAFGEREQLPNAHLQDQLGVDIPAYRGLLSFIFKYVTFSSNSPYFKKLWFEVERVYRAWNEDDASINGHANPAHILYETFTNKQWGMGYPVATINDVSWRSAAALYKGESLGLSVEWKTDQTIEDFIGNILEITGTVVAIDADTGQFKLKPIRYNYTVGTLPTFDEDNVDALEDFQRPTWGESANEVTVSYIDRETHKADQVSVQNMAAIDAQGGVINVKKDFGAIPTAALANMIALRELNIVSTPLSSIRLRVNRDAWNLELGDVFKFSWAKRGLVDVIYRCINIDLGTFSNGTIVIEAAEDYFGMPESTYVSPQPNEWSPPNRSPVTATTYTLVEVPYYLLVQRVGEEEIAQSEPGYGYVGVFVDRPSGMQVNYEINYSPTGSAYEPVRVGSFNPRGELAGDITPLQSVIELTNQDDFSLQQESGSLVFIGDEIAELLAYNPATNEITVNRGVLDTVPQSHDIGTEVWLFDGRTGFDSNERLDGETAYYKPLSKTTTEIDDIANPDAVSITLENRASRPYAPGNIRINTGYFPGAVGATDDLLIEWSHRDRTQQTAGIIEWTDGSIGPEAGVTYTLVIKSAETTIRTVTGLTEESYLYTNEMEIADAGSLQRYLSIELFAVRDGLTSYQTFVHAFTRNTADGVDIGTTPDAIPTFNLNEVVV